MFSDLVLEERKRYEWQCSRNDIFFKTGTWESMDIVSNMPNFFNCLLKINHLFWSDSWQNKWFMINILSLYSFFSVMIK